DGRFVARAGRLYVDQGGLDIGANRVREFLKTQFLGSQIQLRGVHISLRGPVAERNVKLETDRVGREVPAKQLPQDISVSAHKKRVWLVRRTHDTRDRVGGLRHGGSRQSVVAYVADQIQSRQHGGACSGQIDLGVIDLNSA